MHVLMALTLSLSALLAHSAPPAVATRAAILPNQSLEEIRQQSHGDISAIELLREANLRRGKDTRSKVFDFAQMLKKRGKTEQIKRKLKRAIQFMGDQAAHTVGAASTQFNLPAIEARIRFLDEMKTLIPTLLELSEDSLRTLLKQCIVEAQSLVDARPHLDKMQLWIRMANLTDLVTLLSIADRPDWKFLEHSAIRAFSLLILCEVSGLAHGVMPGGLDLVSGFVSSIVVPRIAHEPYHRWRMRRYARSTQQWVAEVTQGTPLESSDLNALVDRMRTLTAEVHAETCAKALTPSGGVHGLF